MVWGAILGGVASAAASIYGAKKAASAAKGAGQLSQKQYQQTREDLAPWRNTGGAANYEVGALYGLPMAYPGGSPAGGAPAGNQLAPRVTTPSEGVQATVPLNAMAGMGRGGDSEMAHVTPGEAVIPGDIMRKPGVMNALRRGFEDEGTDFSRYIVGSGRNSRNPRTGGREFAEPGSGGGYEGRNFDRPTRGDGGYGGGTGAYDRSFGRVGREFERLGGVPEQPRDPRDGGGGGYNQLSGGAVDGFGALQGETPDAYANLPEDYYSQENAINRFYDSPDYRLPFDEGAGAIERSAAGRGGLFSGNTGAALTRYGQQLGGNRYDQYYNHLMGISGLGQNAAAQTGNFGAQSAANQGNAMMQAGNAQAQGGYGVGNAINRGIENYWLMNMLGGAS